MRLEDVGIIGGRRKAEKQLYGRALLVYISI
jgi:hypothetical protein